MLDARDAAAFRAFAHRVLDDALDGLETRSAQPAWTPVLAAVKTALAEPVPREPGGIEAAYADFVRLIAPYDNGNRHSRFVGWVHGMGTASGALAELLAAALNANTGGREHSAVYVERAVIAWSAQIFGFPSHASGILTSGTSLANLIAVVVARRALLGEDVRDAGLRGAQLAAYASTAAHRSVATAFDIAGMGRRALRSVTVDAAGQLDIAALRRAIAADRVAGSRPFMVVASAGTVDTGAIDDLAALADLCAVENLWLHVDGAFGALAVLSPDHRHLLRGIERADSIAFDYHKWLHVPYDAGCVLFRDAVAHRDAFGGTAAYLTPAAAGTAAGEPWFADYGPELSRRFRALAIWFAFKEHGTQRLGAAIAENCRQAAALAQRIAEEPNLTVVAPVALNVVCLRYCDTEFDARRLDALNARIVVELQERGIAVPSPTVIGGRLAIRISLTNHRITAADLETIVTAIAQTGERLAGGGRTAFAHA